MNDPRDDKADLKFAITVLGFAAVFVLVAVAAILVIGSQPLPSLQ